MEWSLGTGGEGAKRPINCRTYLPVLKVTVWIVIIVVIFQILRSVAVPSSSTTGSSLTTRPSFKFQNQKSRLLILQQFFIDYFFNAFLKLIFIESLYLIESYLTRISNKLVR